jgi:hypothetical protein
MQTAAFLAARHRDGDDTGQASQRCHDGLSADPVAFATADRSGCP